jgi:hypothetical protein
MNHLSSILIFMTAGLVVFGSSLYAEEEATLETLQQGLRTSQDVIERLEQKLVQNDQVIADLNTRVEALQTQSPNGAISAGPEEHYYYDDALLALEEKVGTRSLVHAFDAKSLDIGGFFTFAACYAHGKHSSEFSTNQSLLEILIRAQITDDLSFFTALGFLREADLDVTEKDHPTFRKYANRVPQIIAWANYHYSDLIQVQLGRFVTPQGIINIEHFPPILLEINQPQFLRPFSGATMFPNFIIGGQFHGKHFIGEQDEHVLLYHLFSGYFNNAPKDLIAGLRTAYSIPDVGLTVGVNYSHGRRLNCSEPDSPTGTLGHLSIVGSLSATTNDYDQFGADLLIDCGPFLWKNEVWYSQERHEENRLAYYTQPAYRISDEWIVFYRFDFLRAGQTVGKSKEHVVGVNFLPFSTVRTRTAYFCKETKCPGTNTDRRIHAVQTSATVSF